MTRVVARHDLGLLPARTPAEQGLTTVGLDEVGRPRFVAAMLAVSAGDPGSGSTPRSADEDFQELIELAGRRFRPADWYLVRRHDRDVGVLLPQIRPDDPETGTILYMGVVPAARGRHLGRAIHAIGLRELARRGASRYLDGTDAGNAPMIAVLRANGCTVEDR